MNQQPLSSGKNSAIFVATIAVTAIIAFIFGSFGLPELFKPNQFHAFSLFLGLLSGIILAYGIAHFVIKEKFRAKLLSDAVTDPDSGLYSRHYMNEVAPRYVALHQRDPKAGFAVSLIEFEHVDTLLKKHGRRFVTKAYLSMATLIMEMIRETDMVVEYGDYRVAVFSTCEDEERAVSALRRITAEVDGWKIPVSDKKSQDLSVKSSQVVHQADETLSQLLIRAEQLMLKTTAAAKQAKS